MEPLPFVIAELKNSNGELLTVLSVTPKEFRTGSRGYYANQKIVIGERKYQVQIQLVEIGSKKSGEAENG